MIILYLSWCKKYFIDSYIALSRVSIKSQSNMIVLSICRSFILWTWFRDSWEHCQIDKPCRQSLYVLDLPVHHFQYVQVTHTIILAHIIINAISNIKIIISAYIQVEYYEYNFVFTSAANAYLSLDHRRWS